MKLSPEIKARLQRTALLCLLALVIGAGLGYAQIEAAKKSASAPVTPQTLAGIKIGGPFTLTNQDGVTVTEKTYSGQYKIVYFGYTMCPMICPTGLQRIAKTLDKLGPEGDKIQPILITIDPERDTTDVLKQYVKQFHPRLVGLTGTKADIENIERSYHVYATKVQNANMSDYMMDHSSFIYLMSPNDELLALYRDSDTPDFMANDIKSKLN